MLTCGAQVDFADCERACALRSVAHAEDCCTGKSWFAGRYIREWKKQHPDGKVIVFSQVAEDKELDKCGITRVMIDDGLVENPYEVKVGSRGGGLSLGVP